MDEVSAWVLILTLQMGGAAAIDHIIFPSEAACEAAGDDWVRSTYKRRYDPENLIGSVFDDQRNSPNRTYTCSSMSGNIRR